MFCKMWGSISVFVPVPVVCFLVGAFLLLAVHGLSVDGARACRVLLCCWLGVGSFRGC